MLKITASPHLLLTLCVSFWAGNFVLGRAVAGEIPPLALSFWRWTIASLIILPWVIGPLSRNWPLLRANLWRMLVLATLGVAGFNTLVYTGLQHTSAVNALLMQSSLPLQIIALNWLLFGQRSGWGEGVSVMVSLLGVSLIIGAGDPLKLFAGEWNHGDLWALSAVLVWALYSILLRWRPAGLEPMAFLGFILPVGSLIILPLWLWELSQGSSPTLDRSLVFSVAYVAIFPSLLSYLFWNHGVAQLGANRAGHYIHLSPVVGSVLAVLLLGEAFAWYHAAGGLLVATAIVSSALLKPAR